MVAMGLIVFVLLISLTASSVNAFYIKLPSASITRHIRSPSIIVLRVENMKAGTGVDSNNPPIHTGEMQTKRSIYALLWFGLIFYTVLLSPGGSVDAAKIDNELIQEIINTPFDGKISPIFVALFNRFVSSHTFELSNLNPFNIISCFSLGIIPAIYASLLLPGSKKQPVPGLPFVLSSFALGFFGLGPYLALRNYQPNVSQDERGQGSAAFEFKGSSLVLLAFGVFLVYYALNGSYEGDNLSAYLYLFKTQRLAHISTIDFTILSLAVGSLLSVALFMNIEF